MTLELQETTEIYGGILVIYLLWQDNTEFEVSWVTLNTANQIAPPPTTITKKPNQSDSFLQYRNG